MAQKLRFQRPLGERRYKKLFVVSVEGSKTEPQYFAIFNQPQSIVLVKCLKRPSSDELSERTCIDNPKIIKFCLLRFKTNQFIEINKVNINCNLMDK